MAVDFNKPMCTRDGRQVKILSMNHKSSITTQAHSYPIRAEVTHPNEPGKTVTWNYMVDGRWKSNEQYNNNDLINEMIWHRWLREVTQTHCVGRT